MRTESKIAAAYFPCCFARAHCCRHPCRRPEARVIGLAEASSIAPGPRTSPCSRCAIGLWKLLTCGLSSCEQLDAWLAALNRGADLHGLPYAESLVQQLGSIEEHLRSCTQRLHVKGVSDAESLANIMTLTDHTGLAKRWRRDICSRSLSLLESGARDDMVISFRESGGPGSGSWLNPPTMRRHYFSDHAFATAVRLRMHLPPFTSEDACQHVSRPSTHCTAKSVVTSCIDATHCAISQQRRSFQMPPVCLQ